MIRPIAYFVILSGVLAGCGEHGPTNDKTWTRIDASRGNLQVLTEAGFVPDHSPDHARLIGYIETRHLEALSESQRRGLRLDPEPAITDELTQGYHDYPALTEALQEIAAGYPELVALDTIGQSVEGRELWMLKISDRVHDDEEEPRLIYIANMHGDEVVGKEMLLRLARELTTSYQTDATLRTLVDNSEIYLMPSMNPDGVMARRRFNARGIDLNRDFPDHTSDPVDTPDGRAPETRAVMAFWKAAGFPLALNFHGGAVGFNLPWDTASNSVSSRRFADDALIRGLGEEYATLNRPMHNVNGGSFRNGVTYGYEWYEVDGGMQDWSIVYRQSTHATVELSDAKWPPASELEQYWSDNRQSLVRFLERGLHGIHLRLTTDAGQPIAGAVVHLPHRTLTVHGSTLHHPIASTGPISLTIVSQEGTEPRTVSLTPTAFDGTFAEVPVGAGSQPVR